MDRRRATPLSPDLSDVVLHEQVFRAADEVKLADVWTAMVRRKAIIVSLVVVSAVFGILYAFTTPRIYKYTTMIEIGTRYTVSRNEFDGQFEPVEPIETVRAKVEGGYIAQVLREHVAKTNDTRRFDIKAEVPKNSQILVLETRGSAENEATYVALHEAVVERLRLDHLRVQETLRKDLETRLEMQQRSLTELRQQASLFDTQLKRLEGNGQLPVKELSYLTTLRLADNQRAQAQIITLIDRIRLQLANMRETRAIVSPMRSFEPVGLSKGAIVVFSTLLGLIVGIVVALVVQFTRKARGHTDPSTPVA